MGKLKIISLFDKLFITISVFLIIYAWINFYIRDLWATLFLSLLFTSSCVFLIFYISKKKDNKKISDKIYQKNVEENFLAFRLMTKNDKLSLLNNIISKHGETKQKNGCLLIETEDKISQIMVATHIEKLNQFELVNLMQNLEPKVNVLKILVSDFDRNLNTNLLKNLKIEIITKFKLYDEYFNANNSFPDCSNLSNPKERKKFKEIMKNFFVYEKAKSYFFCGLILIFSSIILPYHYYYLIMGSVLLLFSIICKLEPHFKD